MQAGFAVIHANHLEDLTDITIQWLHTTPLAPLENEVFLVQSNGMAQWLKLELAGDEACGISAAQEFQMPQRFLWQAYRSVLGEDQVPRTSPFDKSRLTWRLMRLLPEMLDDETFISLRRFLSEGDNQRKRYQLAERLADLFDQYQVYRADWLDDWEAGRDRIRRNTDDEGQQLSPDQRWQAVLWRRLVADMDEDVRDTSRARIHQRFLAAVDKQAPKALPRRIVVFGISSLPQQVLEALHALSRHCQILMLVQNPCRHYWADIVEDRHLLRIDQHRHATKPELSGFEQDEMHRHAHPLLAAWGKQGRDYIGLLYNYDVPEHYRAWFNEIDAFSDIATRSFAPDSLLADIQQAILDLNPLPGPEHRHERTPDSSLSLQITHSPQREVEVLHDQLLKRFQDSGGELRPRDVIVMVPDIQTYAPHIEAVFGNLDAEDERSIPYTISDRSQGQTLPLAMALEKLLDLPHWRFTVGELLDLLQVPALRDRFNLSENDTALLHQWIRGSGIRWGLHGEQRASLDLPGDFEQNSWWFGLRRMLLGYAVGPGEAWHAIEPYDEVGGLQADRAGRLVQLLDTLEEQWRELSRDGTPADWVARLRNLMASLFSITEPEDLQLETTLLDELEEWKAACDEAGFAEELPLTVASQAWLTALDQSSLSQRFLAGRVNFCTLMPMRSIPFRVVCLLGMNDKDYPRSQTPLDFDLMALPGQYRPGDRSRREDDRYLFLEALLSAREQLYLSWVGRNVRDNDVRPPSVLVAQLQDYIDNGWITPDGESLLDELTGVHPLQPFSTRYFDHDETDQRLFSYAREWLEAHKGQAEATQNRALNPPDFEETPVLTPGRLAGFLKQPARLFFQERLKVRFERPDVEAEDAEPFDFDALERFDVTHALLTAARQAPDTQALPAMEATEQRLRRAGRIPAGVFGDNLLADISDHARTTVDHWHALRAGREEENEIREIALPVQAGQQPVQLEHWLTDLLVSGERHARIRMLPNELRRKPWNALPDWLVHLFACSGGLELTTVLISGDTRKALDPVEPDDARATLEALVQGWYQGQRAPLPVACKTAFVWLANQHKAHPEHEARKEYEGDFNKKGERDYTPELARSYDRFDAMAMEQPDLPGDFEGWTRALYEPLLQNMRDLAEGERV
jgi:exodeoxyribonuclease V gamma subunit